MKLSRLLNFKLFSMIIISCLGIIVYSNTFHCSFHLDDETSITTNLSIRNILDLQDIWNYLPRRFILYLSLALNYHFSQLDVFGYHIFNITVHLISAILVWWLTLLTFSTAVMKENKITQHANLVALMAGLIFVSHPVQTQAVTYIVQRAASLATMFYLASLCFYVKSRLIDEKGSTSGLWIIFYVGSVLTAVAAMFTKEIAITLPLMIVLYEFSFLKTKKNIEWFNLTPFLLIIFIIPLTMVLTELDKNQQAHGFVAQGPSDISTMHYLLTQLRVMVTYIRLVLLPVNQNLDYDYPISKSIFELPTLFSFLFLMAILYSAKRLFFRYRIVSFSIFWFFLTLLPESSLFPIQDVIFEHRLYLPLVGYSLFLVSSMYYLIGKNSIKAMAIGLTMIIVCNSVLTYQRNKVWRNEITLWDDTVRKSPNKARPHNNRGSSYYNQGNLKQAMNDYNEAIKIDPEYSDAFKNRITIYAKEGNFAQAILDFNKAIELDPDLDEAYINRGIIYELQGNVTQALADYTKAIELNTSVPDVYNFRGLIYYYQGKAAQALSDFNNAIEINPQYAEAYNNRGLVYYKQGNNAQAVSDFNTAVEINPLYAEAYNDRGIVDGEINDFDQAISDYTKAIELYPYFEQAYGNRGRIYYFQGKYAKALSDYNKAIAIIPRDANPYSNRALVYFYLKDYAKSWADVHKVRELGTDVNPQLIDALKQASGQYK